MMASPSAGGRPPQHRNISFHFNLKLYSQVTFKLALTMALLKFFKISKNTESEQMSCVAPKIYSTTPFIFYQTTISSLLLQIVL